MHFVNPRIIENLTSYDDFLKLEEKTLLHPENFPKKYLEAKRRK